MRVTGVVGAVVLVLAAASAAELTSGIPVGGKMPRYKATKCGGGDDGVELGKSLCYTWRLGGRPVVFIVAKAPDDGLAMLAKQIDAMVVAQHEKKLAAVVNFLGEANDKTKQKIKEFGRNLSLKVVPLAITADGDKFKISNDAAVTVMIYRGKKVKSNYALPKGSLDQKTAAAIVESVKKMLAEPAEQPKEKPKPKHKASEDPQP